MYSHFLMVHYIFSKYTIKEKQLFTDLYESPFYLTNINRWIYRFTQVHYNISSKDIMISGETIYFHHRYCSAICVIIKRAANTSIRIKSYTWCGMKSSSRQTDSIEKCSRYPCIPSESSIFNESKFFF